MLDLTVDGADEVDPQLDLIKGYGRDMVQGEDRRHVLPAADHSRGRRQARPETGNAWEVARRGGSVRFTVVPAASLAELGCQPIPYFQEGSLFVTDNGNHMIDCQVQPIADATRLELAIRAIPGVVGTGLFLGMADTVLVGYGRNFR